MYYIRLPKEDGWSRCDKCECMVKMGLANVCPAGGTHVASADINGNGSPATYTVYTVPNGADTSNTQPGWQACRKCGCLTFPVSSNPPCAAGGRHDWTGSLAYAIENSGFNNPEQQSEGGWNACTSCGTAFFGTLQQQSQCPGRSGGHNPYDSSYRFPGPPRSGPTPWYPSAAILALAASNRGQDSTPTGGASFWAQTAGSAPVTNQLGSGLPAVGCASLAQTANGSVYLAYMTPNSGIKFASTQHGAIGARGLAPSPLSGPNGASLSTIPRFGFCYFKSKFWLACCQPNRNGQSFGMINVYSSSDAVNWQINSGSTYSQISASYLGQFVSLSVTGSAAAGTETLWLTFLDRGAKAGDAAGMITVVNTRDGISWSGHSYQIPDNDTASGGKIVEYSEVGSPAQIALIFGQVSNGQFYRAPMAADGSVGTPVPLTVPNAGNPNDRNRFDAIGGDSGLSFAYWPTNGTQTRVSLYSLAPSTNGAVLLGSVTGPINPSIDTPTLTYLPAV